MAMKDITSSYAIIIIIIIIISHLNSAYYRKKEHRCYSKIKKKNYYKT